jgi:chromate reductase, NAD(P)H dehydrogenase (quinone)
MSNFYPEKKTAKVLGIVGSLRVNSLNGTLMKASKNLLPDWVEFEMFDIGGIPHYNQDVEDSRIPGIVSDLREKVREADVILMAAPEYNGSVSGVLKDALDWASRPYGDSALSGKPVAVLSAVSGRNGGRAVLDHLTQIIDYLDAKLIGEPVLVQLASQKFDSQSKIADAETIEKVKKLVAVIVEEPPIKAKTPIICEVPGISRTEQ